MEKLRTMLILVSVVFLTTFTLCLVLRDSSAGPAIGIYNSKTTVFATNQSDSEGRKLVRVLRRAAMETRTVILTMVDKSWASPGSVLDLFLKSFHTGKGTERLLNHLVVVGLDGQSFRYCQSIHPHCFYLRTTGGRHARLNKQRNDLLTLVLKFGFNVVYTDADVMWLRNPFELFEPKSEISIGCHHSSKGSSNHKKASAGFFHMLSTDMSIEVLKIWDVAKILHPNLLDGTFCEFIEQLDLVETVGLHIRFIEPTHYGDFCGPNSDIGKTYTMHANCCDDLEKKVHDLKLALDDSRRSKKALSWNISNSNERTLFPSRELQ